MFPTIHPMRPDRGPILAKAALLFGLAAYFALNIVTGNLSNYINTRFAWLSIIAVVLFAALGAAVLSELRGNARISHLRIRLPSLIIMAVPLVLGTLIPSRPLGAEAIEGGLQVGAASYSAADIALVAKDPLDRDVLDWSRLFVSEQSPTVFNGQAARVLGFVYKEPAFPEGTFMIGRFTLSCCVADASALGLPAYLADGVEDLAAGVWVEVEGTFQAQEFLGSQVPVLQIAKLTPTDEPEQPYLYP